MFPYFPCKHCRVIMLVFCYCFHHWNYFINIRWIWSKSAEYNLNQGPQDTCCLKFFRFWISEFSSVRNQPFVCGSLILTLNISLIIPFGVATFGFEPPMTPGLTDPVSSYLKIFFIFGKIHFFWRTWSEFLKHIHVKLAILLKYHMVWFHPLTFWRFLAEFIIENLDLENRAPQDIDVLDL